jgi:hypothetical protein
MNGKAPTYRGRVVRPFHIYMTKTNVETAEIFNAAFEGQTVKRVVEKYGVLQFQFENGSQLLCDFAGARMLDLPWIFEPEEEDEPWWRKPTRDDCVEAEEKTDC